MALNAQIGNSHLRMTGQKIITIMNTKTEIPNILDCRDELFQEAADFVTSTGKCGVTIFQEHFGIGFHRATRLVGQLTKAGVEVMEDLQKNQGTLIQNSFLCSSKNSK